MGWGSVIGGIVVAAVGFRDPSSTKSDLTFANYAVAAVGLLVPYFATSWAMPWVGSWAGGTPFRWGVLAAALLLIAVVMSAVVPP
jgi:hypothetical protein